MLVKRLTTSEWIECIDREEQEVMNERQTFNEYIHVEGSNGRQSICGRDLDNLTYLMTRMDYRIACNGVTVFYFQKTQPFCGTCNKPEMFI